MEKLQGVAVNVRTATGVWASSGGHANGHSSVHVGTDHTFTFQIGNQVVRVTSSSPPVIEPNDEIVVVGRLAADGIFHASYYVNRSKNVRLTRGSSLHAASFAAVLLLVSFGSLSFGTPASVLVGICCFVGFILCCYEVVARKSTASLLGSN